MSATAAPAIKSATIVPGRAAAADARSAPTEHDFDRRLDAARQQHRADPAADAAPSVPDDAHAKPAHASPPTDGKDAPAPAKAADPADPASDAATLAAAMLAMLGQAAPVVAPAIALPVAGSPASAGGSRAALAALSATGAPKAAASNPLGVLLEDSAGAASAAVPVAMPSSAAAAVTDLLPSANAPKDDRAAALQDLAAQAAAMSAPAPNLASPSGAHLLSVASPVGTTAFAQDLGQQISWLGTQDLKQARIKLHPEDLGPLDIKMSVTHDRVDLTFIAQHPATVHAVQQSLAHLDTLLAQHGMTLGHADVSQQQRGGGNERSGNPGSRVGEPEDVGATAALSPLSRANPTLLDTFA